MKKLIFFFLVLVSFTASAQWTIINGKQRFAKGLGIPVSDTVSTLLPDSAQMVLRPQDSSIYFKFHGKWRKVNGGGSGAVGTLQEVTDNGATTNHDISVNTIKLFDPLVGYYEAQISGNSNGGFTFIDKNEDELIKIGGSGNGASNLTFGNTTYGKATLIPSGSNPQLTLPSNTGTLALLSDITYPDTSKIATHHYVDSSVSANKTDTTNLSDRINLKLNITDTANKWVNNIYRKDGKDSIFFYIGGTEYKIKDSIYSGNTLTLQQVITNGRALTNNNNFQGNYSGTSSYSFTNVNAFGEYSAYTNRGTYVNAMGYQSAMGNIKNDVNAFGYNSCYGNNGQNVNSMGNGSCQGQSGNNVNAFGATSAFGNSGADVNAFGNYTAVNNSYNSINLFGNGATATSNNQTVFATDGNKKARLTYNSLTADREYTFPNKSGTFAMTSDITTSIDTTSLSNRINTKIDSLKRSTDSIFAYKNGVAYFQYKDSVGGANGFVPYTGATQDVDLGNFSINAKSVKINGTNGNGHIDLKHQTSDATATGSSTVLFANNNGDLKWKNDTKFYTTLKTNQNADQVYTFQNKTYTLADSADVVARVKYTDTSTMLSPYLRKTDTSNLSTRIDAMVKYTDTSSMLTNYVRAITLNGYTKISDTSTMLSPYLRKVDTATLSSRINLKVNISDTSTMLNKYLRKSDTATLSDRINLKVNYSDTATMLSKYLRKTDTASLSSRIDNNTVYAINFGMIQTSFAASQTYYFGIAGSTATGTANTKRVYIPTSGTVKEIYIYSRSSSGTSGENWSMIFRLNNTSFTTIATTNNTSLDKVFSNTNLNVSVNAGDYFEIGTTVPATAPGNTNLYGTLIIR